ncbi:lipase member H [Chanos chanos]|uniref:Lipase member H n=1 Tax=Chanos chanos TaxID=29144 RepID=A0A6J2UQA2_CHACN|nr:lipase member H-like [Chanos chanos]
MNFVRSRDFHSWKSVCATMMECGQLLWWLLGTTLLSLELCRAQMCDDFTELSIHHSIIGTKLQVKLLLYTRANGSCGQALSHNDPSIHHQLNTSRPTTFIVHGYRPTGSPPVWMTEFVELLLARGDMNVIVVDWNHGATTINYLKAVENTRLAAKNITAFIQKLQKLGASLSSIHMIGISLGAHISGFVGASLNGDIGRITALDPAGPQFRDAPIDERLDSGDAQFVDVLHTDVDALGYREPIGHIDFYANGGADQPGCPQTILSGTEYFKCDHQRSVFLYLSSLNKTCPLISYPCSSYVDFLNAKCLACEHFKPSGCPVFGYDVIAWKDTLPKLGQTKAFFTTNEASPFCKFMYKVDILTWNQETCWGYITVKLHSNGRHTEAKINHNSSKFEQYTDTSLLAQFGEDLQPVHKISVKFCTGNVLRPAYKLRLLRIRLTPLQSNSRSLCRYDLLLEENRDITFRPIPCQGTNF